MALNAVSGDCFWKTEKKTIGRENKNEYEEWKKTRNITIPRGIV